MTSKCCRAHSVLVSMQVLLTAHRQQLHAAEIEQLRHSLDVSTEPALPVRRPHDLFSLSLCRPYMQ